MATSVNLSQDIARTEIFVLVHMIYVRVSKKIRVYAKGCGHGDGFNLGLLAE